MLFSQMQLDGEFNAMGVFVVSPISPMFDELTK
jgi:hypothetical protein